VRVLAQVKQIVETAIAGKAAFIGETPAEMVVRR
jgi:hypothetical protein